MTKRKAKSGGKAAKGNVGRGAGLRKTGRGGGKEGRAASEAAARKGAVGAAVAKAAGENAERDLLDMGQAIEMLKTTRPTFYRWLRSGKIKGMKVGRQWRFFREDIERFLSGEGPRIDLPADIEPLLRSLRGCLRQFAPDVPAAEVGSEPSVQAVYLMLQLEMVARASDLHLAVQSDGAHLRLRIDGVLHEVLTYDLRLHPAVIAAWKTVCGCDLRETQLPQDGRVVCELPGASDKLDFRLNLVPAQGGEAATARLIRSGEVRLSFDRLEFGPGDREKVLRHVEAPSGLVIVSGPTGCGKTTTFYAFLNHLNRPERKLVSVEDPVELAIDGVVQVSVRPHPSRTFPAVCRALLRTDPDVILVGEVRDLETAALCTQMALTGHLIFTTLHTNSAAEALVRMVEIGVEPFVVADATKLVIGQRLVRRLCPSCNRVGTPGAAELEWATAEARLGGVRLDAAETEWRLPVGCRECRQTGYRGRAMLTEVMEVTAEVAQAIRRGAGAAELRTTAVGQGMTPLAAGGVLMASQGKTSLAEAMRVAACR